MAQAIRQTIYLWVSLLLLGGLTFFVLRTPMTREWMWSRTGEEAFGAQVKGLTDLASDLLRPRLALAADIQVQYAGEAATDLQKIETPRRTPRTCGR